MGGFFAWILLVCYRPKELGSSVNVRFPDPGTHVESKAGFAGAILTQSCAVWSEAPNAELVKRWLDPTIPA